MIKVNAKDNPVLYIYIDQGTKEALKLEAQKQGMQLSTYCRMILIKSLGVK